MLKKILVSVSVFGVIAAALILSSPAGAANISPQVYYQTPTPRADGRIIYVVKPNDTCISVSLLTGVTLEQLRTLNNLKGVDCPLQAGQELLLGLGEKPAQQTPSPAPGAAGPTSTPPPGAGVICVYLFNDINGNSVPDGSESAIQDGAVNITDRDRKVSLSGKTGLDPLCFQDVPEGDYNISVAVPQGYNPTTSLNTPLQLKGGDKSTLDFGAQISGAAVQPTITDGIRSPLLGIAGALLVLGGIGLGVYVYLLRRSIP